MVDQYTFLPLAQKFIKENEGLRLKPYKCTAGKTTIGYGRNLDDVGISPVEAEYLLQTDISHAINHLMKYPWFLKLNENGARLTAMVDMCFNLGTSGFDKFNRMIVAMTIRDYKTAADEAQNSRWYEQVGRRGEKVVYMIRTGEFYDAT